MKPDEESAKVILMFSVYDLKARAYMAPFTAVTPGVALREFARAVQQERSPFAQFPADFALHQVGSFNEATGQCVSPVPPIPLAMATEFVQGDTGSAALRKKVVDGLTGVENHEVVR